MSVNTEIVMAFCRAWEGRDAGEIASYFSEDAVYHNIPVPPVQGKASIHSLLQSILAPATWIEWEVLNIGESGNLVFTERVDRFDMAGKRVELPVAGVFEIQDGKIRAWRDYFDMATWTRQTTG